MANGTKQGLNFVEVFIYNLSLGLSTFPPSTLFHPSTIIKVTVLVLENFLLEPIPSLVLTSSASHQRIRDVHSDAPLN